MLQGVEVEHVLEVEAELVLDAVVGQTQLLESGTLDCSDEVAEVVDDAHADEVERFEVFEAEDELVEVLEDLGRRWLCDDPALGVLFFQDASMDSQVFEARSVSLLLHLTGKTLQSMWCIHDTLKVKRLKC